MTSTLVTHIGELTTNDPERPDLLGTIADAALVVDGGTVAWVGRRTDAPEADLCVDVGGRAVLYLERGGRSLLTLPAAADADLLRRALSALPSLVAPQGPYRELRLDRVDRAPVGESSAAEALAAIGFRSSFRGWVLRRA